MAWALATAVFAFAAPSVASTCEATVDVQVAADACGTVFAVSVTGDAEEVERAAIVSCITGNATNAACESSYGAGTPYSVFPTVRTGCIAVSGRGTASNSAGPRLVWDSRTRDHGLRGRGRA